MREISLSNGDEPVRVYDTTGPQNYSPIEGLPKRRQAWIDKRIERGDQNFSQMHYARQGVLTEEMQFIALRENMEPEFVRQMQLVELSSRQTETIELEPMIIGRNFRED